MFIYFCYISVKLKKKRSQRQNNKRSKENNRFNPCGRRSVAVTRHRMICLVLFTGVRRTEEEMDFGNFDLFKDKSCPYNSENFQYSELDFERLAQLVQFNVRNNKAEIENQVKRCVKRKEN